MRVAEELRGNSASLRVAAKRSSIGTFLSRAIVLSALRRLANCFAILRRRLFFSTILFFAMPSSPYGSAYEGRKRPSLPEREVKCSQQCARFVVGACARANGDIETPGIGDL